MQDETRNLVLFAICTVVLLMVYQIFVLGPATKRREIEAKARAAAEAQSRQAVAGPAAIVTIPRSQALEASPRVQIDTPALKGSLALKGAKIDDLYLKGYRVTVDKASPPVELFRPPGASDAFFAEFGWSGTNLLGLPGEDTLWTTAPGQPLSPDHPVTLTYASPQGLKFTRTISVDKDFMFTVTDQVANQSGSAVTLAPYASVQRRGLPADILTAINVHQGALGWLGEDKQYLRLAKYASWKKKGEIDYPSRGGWAGITDKYWMATLIPDQHEAVRTAFRSTSLQNVDVYDATVLGQARALAPGAQITVSTRLFAGAKTAPLLKSYSKSLGVPELDRAIDWGNLWFLTRPIFGTLEFFFHHFGSFGAALLMLTVCVRLLMFLPANMSYSSSIKMKKIQPEVEKLRQRFKDDPAKQQQEMMALWQRERINPLLGCLPMLATIPVFLALFKVLSVTIEMRHAPFFGLVQDLSAPDPSTIWNLFGVLPYDPATLPFIGSMLGGGGFLHIGVWAIAYAFTTWISQSMTPTTGMDPTQQKMMQLMPWFFMFIMARFTVGLLIYYTWSNTLTVVQQYVLMRRFKVDNPIDGFVRRLQGRLGRPPDQR
jgi:YidC/Oxa1 family membrane protein insertase